MQPSIDTEVAAVGTEKKDPINKALDKLELTDAALGRVFGVSRQAIKQWREYTSIPRHMQRTFEVVTGLSLEEQARFAEVKNGVNFVSFCQEVKRRILEERGY
jgi:hypothetical protein